ncbi:preprotein translocase subunit SecE [Sporotomaculum syntrophicum]|uniref:Protein translocase subunit SecE n=1 Tax=Sporotomaculum syntrophicum TaxID=182264 RepID=A0A9D2WMY3_9FIRM|nr:preprotein translocase subunit SecE [Sporotomaculum syntrophicum]KAF1083701.1 preprotein translocase subunit SecE [Sporotomaculum syntrophicum]
MAVAKNQDGSMKKDKGTGAGKELAIKDSRKEVARKSAAANKPNRIEHTKSFFRGVMNELKRVHWPTRKETMIYTAVVLVSVVFVAVLIWVFDIILGSAMGMLIK